jgi:glycosyltransferase involved in cell wall biosynthesis
MALRCWHRQTVPAHERELIIVDDGDEAACTTPAVADQIGRHLGVRYQYSERVLPTGTKLNRAVALARGEWIAAWPDDDWQAPDRLEVEIRALAATGARACTFQAIRVFELATRRLWLFDAPGRGIDGPLVFHRSLVEATHGHPFPDVFRAPWGPIFSLARPVILAGHDHRYVALRHGGNTWDLEGERAMNPLFPLDGEAPPAELLEIAAW